MNDKTIGALIGAAIVFILTYMVLWPLAGIWSLNTLFDLTIPFTFKTWLAASLIGSAVGRSTYSGGGK